MTTLEGDTESDGGADRVRISMLQGGTSTVAPRWPDVHPFFHPLVTSFQGKILTEKYQKRREGGCRSTTFFTSMCREKTKCPHGLCSFCFFFNGKKSCSEWVCSLWRSCPMELSTELKRCEPPIVCIGKVHPKAINGIQVFFDWLAFIVTIRALYVSLSGLMMETGPPERRVPQSRSGVVVTIQVIWSGENFRKDLLAHFQSHDACGFISPRTCQLHNI